MQLNCYTRSSYKVITYDQLVMVSINCLWSILVPALCQFYMLQMGFYDVFYDLWYIIYGVYFVGQVLYVAYV